VAARELGAHLLGAELGVEPRRVDPLAPHDHLWQPAPPPWP
jgi:hypothetical protein